MRVLFVSNLWPPRVVGGAELYASSLADRVAARGHEVGAVTLGIDGPHVVAELRPWPYRVDRFREQPTWKKVVFHATDLYRPGVRSALERAAIAFRADVVHTHTVAGYSAVALSSPGGNLPHVHTLHDYWLLCVRSTLTHAGGRPCGRACQVARRVRRTLVDRHPPAAVHAPSQAVFDEHASRGFAFDSSHRVALRHPVEPALKRSARTPHESPTFGFIGQLNPNKGVDTLLSAFRSLDLPGAQLRFAGKGMLEGAVRNGEAEGILYDGWVADEAKEAFFASIDCLVVPSEWPEPAGLVINEAKVRGLPVIGAAVGGIPEYIPRRSRPLLFAAGDAAALTDRLNRVAADANSFAPVDEDLSPVWDAHVDEIVQCYEIARR